MLQPDTPSALQRLALTLALFALAILSLAGVTGWALSHDAARDLKTLTARLRALTRADDPNLGQPLAVTSTDEVGELTAAVGHLRTALEQELHHGRASYQQATEAERRRTSFIGDVSHELRTPLSTLCGFAQLLLREEEGSLSQEQRADVEVIYKGGEQLLELVNDVLDLSVIEAEAMVLELTHVDLGTLVAEIVKANAPNVPSGVSLEQAVASELPIISADRRRVRQVVQNLLSNALKFTQQGTVSVRVEVEQGALLMAVEDTGIGISAVDLPDVFEKYRQAGSLSSKRKGSGLGLAICRHIVESHNGTIWAESTFEEGSTFYVRWPLAEVSR